MGTPRNTPAKFWARVDRSGGENACWPWLGCDNGNGYGRVWWHGGLVLTHRLSFFLAKGRWPSALGCHTCDNPPCCNPAHVFDGTNRENMQDKMKKGRCYRKLSDDDVRAILAMRGGKHLDIAAKFEVSRSLIGLIMSGKLHTNTTVVTKELT